jgi:hypothetical protein
MAMRIIEPCAASEYDRRGIEEAAGSIVGASLTAVRYFYPQFSSPQLTSYDGFDTILKGVELSSAEHVIAAMWWVEGAKEGLGFVVDPDGQFYNDEALQILDVSSESQWAPFRASRVVSAALSWHLPDDDLSNCVWAFRLNFASGRSVTVALGDVDEVSGTLTYQPDSVAAIFDEKVARRYRILASSESAWGSIIS